MKIRAITYDEVQNLPFDPLHDVEIEVTVAKLNCIVQRDFHGGDKYGTICIDGGVFGYGLVRSEVIKRFRNAGWKITKVTRMDQYMVEKS